MYNDKVKSKPGRKNAFSPELLKRLLSYIKDGLNYKQATAAAGISESTFRKWRNERPDVAERVQAAREVMRAKVLAEIKKAGAKDWRALAEFLRLSFSEYRFASGPSVNIAVKQTLEVSDPERAELIARREKALAHSEPPQPLQLADASDARAIALEAEAKLNQGVIEVNDPEPQRLREQPPKNVVDRDALAEERRQWRDAARRDEVEEILGD